MKEGGPFYYDIDGTPISDTLTWGRLMETRREDGSFRIGDTTLADGTWISTVWLGLDHRWGMGPPLIFETMVFPKAERSELADAADLDMTRYSTLAQAKAGHEAMVAKWTKLVALAGAYKKADA